MLRWIKKGTAMKQTSAWDLVVVGGAYTDYVVQGPKIPEQGETTLSCAPPD
jgi:hypothetical protein